MKKPIMLFVAVILVAAMLFTTVSAAPTDAFSRKNNANGNSTSTLARDMYSATEKISADTLGLDVPLEGISDICFDADGMIYILCGGEGNAALTVLNSDYTLNREISVTENGQPIDYSGAQGVFVDKDYNIYITDTTHARVLVTDKNGNLKKTLTVPDSPLIPADFVYQPTAFCMDNKGYFYILSLGCYYGALSYSPDGEFLGFYGANTVKASALATLQFLWSKLTDNDTKKSQSAKTLPYSFVDLCVDSEGYVLTCTGQTDYNDNGSGQVRKTNSKGANILYKSANRGKAVSSSSVNFLEDKVVRRNKHNYVQNIVSVATDDEDYIYILDNTYGLVYVYDKECNLLNGFGGGLGNGDQLGTFANPVSLAVYKDTLLVADFKNCSVTVFKRTDYGNKLYAAQSMQIMGDYEQSHDLWQQVLDIDSGNQLAYCGLANYYYSCGDYENALNYAEKGMDYNIYNLSHQELLKASLAKNFIWILLILIICIVAIVFAVVTIKKRKTQLIQNQKIRTLGGVIFHPFKTFDEIKYKKRGSVIISLILMALLFISYTLKSTASGFLYRTADSESFNLFFVFLQTVGVLMLWVVANRLVCTLFSGKGTFGEVLTASAYSFTPLIITTLIYVVLSHFIPLSASGILNALGVIGWIYSLFLLCISMITIHEYDFFKFLSTGIAVIFFMIVIVFVIFFILIMLNLSGKFLTDIFEEITFR